MVIIGNQNRISIKAGCSMNDIRKFALWEICCTGVDFLLRRIHLDYSFLQIIQKLMCAQRLGVFFILENE